MKITKNTSGKTEVRISKSEWKAIGKKAQWYSDSGLPDDTGIQQDEDLKRSTHNKVLDALSESLWGYDSKDDCKKQISSQFSDQISELVNKIVDSDIGREPKPDELDQTEDNLSDIDADSMTLRDAGYGTDEDYGSASDVL